MTLSPSQTLVGSGTNATAREMSGSGAIQLSGAAGTVASPTLITSANLSNSELTLRVSGHQSLAGVTLGSVPITVDAGSSLTLTAAQASGRKIGGGGQVVITALGASPQADLSGVSAAATAAITSSAIFKGSLGNVELVVSPAVALTVNGTIVSGAKVSGGGRLIVVTGEIAGPTGTTLSPVEALQKFDLSRVEIGRAHV